MSLEVEIRSKLQAEFQPLYLEVVNESDGHNVAPGSETHFKVVIVSDGFEGLRAVARHQKVYAVLADALKSGLHALALHTYTSKEWSIRDASPSSPPCLGGSGA